MLEWILVMEEVCLEWDDQCHLQAVSLLAVPLELVPLVPHMDFSVRSVTCFVLVSQLEDQDPSIGLQRSIVECFLELEVVVVQSLETYHRHCHLVKLEVVVVLEVEVVEVVKEVILHLLNFSLV